MDVGHAIGQVPGAAASIPRILVNDLQHEQYSTLDRNTMVAVWIAKNLSLYQPRVFIPLPQNLVDYCLARIHGRLDDRNPLYHAKLGHWTSFARKVDLDNLGDLQLLLWARGYLVQAALKNFVDEIDARISEYELMTPEHLDIAHQCQAMDARAKAWKAAS